uniref:Calcineurin-like phosphoesterase domain-containing protein n=1 Tax=viral metagenome TaxID=1070528 RepID=A0A6C0CPH7_9ZZZZ
MYFSLFVFYCLCLFFTGPWYFVFRVNVIHSHEIKNIPIYVKEIAMNAIHLLRDKYNTLHNKFWMNHPSYFKHGNITLYLMIFITTLYIMSTLFVFIGPYAISDHTYLTFMKSIARSYGKLNWIKTLVFLLMHTFIYAIFMLIIVYRFFSVSTILVLIFTLGLVWLLFFLYYMPCQTPFGLTAFGKLYKPKSNSIITFTALGDTQEFGNHYGRFGANKLAVNSMNAFVRAYTNLRTPSMSDILGCVIPGDCTQTGQDGRLCVSNYLGDYELKYGLGSNSGLQLPVYECTGNHDWDVTAKTMPSDIIFFNTCPTVNMIKRRNKYRTIVVQDTQGNYMWKFGPVYMIALNCWPAKESDLLLSGKPAGSLKFLAKALSKLNANDKYMIVTHFIPIDLKDMNNNDFASPPDFPIDVPTLVSTECEPLLALITTNLLAMIIGHLHLSKTFTTITDDGIRVIIPPSPANMNYNGNFVLFQYDTTTETLEAYEVDNEQTMTQLF